MPLPEGFNDISPWPWKHIASHIDRVVDAEGKEICDDTRLYDSPATDREDQVLIALAPDHALLLAAVARGVAQVRIGNQSIHVPAFRCKDGGRWPDQWFPYTLDPFGCPVLTDEARTAIVKALEA